MATHPADVQPGMKNSGAALAVSEFDPTFFEYAISSEFCDAVSPAIEYFLQHGITFSTPVVDAKAAFDAYSWPLGRPPDYVTVMFRAHYEIRIGKIPDDVENPCAGLHDSFGSRQNIVTLDTAWPVDDTTFETAWNDRAGLPAGENWPNSTTESWPHYQLRHTAPYAYTSPGGGVPGDEYLFKPEELSSFWFTVHDGAAVQFKVPGLTPAEIYSNQPTLILTGWYRQFMCLV